MMVPRIAAASAGALTLLALAGCTQLSQKRLDYTRTEQAKVDQITVLPGAGDVVVHGGQVRDVTIKRIVRYRGDEPRDATYRIDGTGLVLDTDCGRQCSVSYEVTLPEGVAVRGENGSGNLELSRVGAVEVRAGSGDIAISMAKGAVTAETGSGDITVADVTGAVAVRAGSGNVTGRGLGAGVTADTGSGEIILALGAPGSVRASAGSGSVALSVPAGRYHVQADAESGSRNVSVTDDPGAPLLLDLHTGSGDITVAQV